MLCLHRRENGRLQSTGRYRTASNLVESRNKIGEWQTREGEPRTSFDIWADDVVNLSPPEDGSRGQDEESTSSAPNGRPAQPAAAAQSARCQDEELDELPF